MDGETPSSTGPGEASPGRGVVLDMVRTLADEGRPYEPGTSAAFSVEDLELARQRAGVDFRPGDILLVHTGFARWYLEQPLSVRARFGRSLATPGLAAGEEMCRYLWDAHVSAVASDTFAVRGLPARTGTAPPASSIGC